MAETEFLTLFPKLPLEEGDRKQLREGMVQGVELSKSSRSLVARVAFPRLMDPELLERAETGIRRMLDLRAARISPRYAPELLGSDGFQNLRAQVKRRIPSANGFLDQADWIFSGNTLHIELKAGGAEFLAGCPAVLRELAEEQYGVQIAVFVENDGKTEEELQAELEALRQKALSQKLQEMPAPKEKKRRAQGAAGALLGRAAKGEPVPMNTLTAESGTVCVTGRVFAENSRDIKNKSAWVMSFDMTDNLGSVRVTSFMRISQKKDAPMGKRGRSYPQEAIDALQAAINPKKSNWLTVQGTMKIDDYTQDLILDPENIFFADPPEGRRDTAPEKRVELHLHTRMSLMDALTDTKKAVARAAEWGHSAIAITDHGVVQSFPDAMSAAKGTDVKILYGCEGYFSGSSAGGGAVDGPLQTPLEGEFVAFDLETTGLHASTDEIIEIAATVVRDGELGERYHTYVDPGRPIPGEITQLTGIHDGMVKGAPSIGEALPEFLNFVAGRPLLAHNAAFDMGFIRQNCARLGIFAELTGVDTLTLSRVLLPELKRYKLNLVAAALNLPEFTHHRAGDDADTVAYMAKPLFDKLRDRGLNHIGEINAFVERERTGEVRPNRRSQHIILLVKNQQGLRNLYQIVSHAHLKYFKRFPLIPKHLLDSLREGLIVGSACESGELFSAIVARRPWAELKRIASYYDFLEIQPIGNNAFLVANGAARDEEELREFNRTVVKLGEELKIPVAATGDVHFLDPEDAIYRGILMHSKGFPDADRQPPLYFKTTDEMLEEFSYLGPEKAREVVVAVPNQIAGWCENVAPLPKGLFVPKLENSEEDLKNLVWGKAERLYGEDMPPLIRERLDTELQSIVGKYDVVYMSAQKLVSKSLEDGYLVGSRGSVGSSLVAYMAGITEVNSLPPHYRCPSCKHADFSLGDQYGCGVDMPDALCPQCGTPYEKDGFNIPFEVFLGYGGGKVPDIDLNFSGEYQASAHKYTATLFGEDHVFRAGTIGTVAEKTAFGYVKKYLEDYHMTATRAEENRLALGCVGVRRTTGQHPGGLVVIPGDKEIYDFCPAQHPADDTGTDIVTTHFEYHCMESNLLKLDELGHDDPTMIKMLEDLTGEDAKKIPLDDPDTMSLFVSSEKLGLTDDPILGPTGACAIPEFGTKFVREMLLDIKPSTFDALVRISGFSHGTDVWLGNAKDLIVSKTADISQVIGCRDDIMLYLIHCGVNEEHAFKIMEKVRKGKGLTPEDEAEMRENHVPQWYIDSCLKIKYLFPKAHAVAYVTMAYRIAWFKVHRPLAFYAAYFTIRAKAFDAAKMTRGLDVVLKTMRELDYKTQENTITANEKDMQTTLEVCYEFYKRGFTFEPMDLYKSHATKFLVTENGLRPPFISLSGLGETAAIALAEQSRKHTFVSAEELQSFCGGKVSKTHLEQLRELGALGDLPETSQITLF